MIAETVDIERRSAGSEKQFNGAKARTEGDIPVCHPDAFEAVREVRASH
jgi:hypothetical protein